MSYEVCVLPSAERELERIPAKDSLRLLIKIQALSRDPRPQGVQKIRGLAGSYRIRGGDYRILYRIDEKMKRVFIYAVGHRKDVYRG